MGTEVKLLVVSLSLFCVAIKLIVATLDYNGVKQTLHQIIEEQARKTHLAVVNEYMRERQNWTTSVLGSRLFKYNNKMTLLPQNRKFYVYVYSSLYVGKAPLEGCSVQNCIFTKHYKRLSTADAVLVRMYRGNIPRINDRKSKQRWIFLNDESPINAFQVSNRKIKLEDLANFFNWSMTHRIDADIPVPYGRTVPLEEPVFTNFDTSALTEIIPYWQRKRRDVLAAIMISNCHVEFRLNFISDLQKHIPVDVYGMCSKNNTIKYRCPGHYKKDCDLMSEYLFYLAIENSDCREYITEKAWYNGYLKGAVPIIMGPSLNDCKRLLPPNSFLHISVNYDEDDVKELANRMIHLSEDDDSLLSLHEWRNHFETTNEHEFFSSKSQRLCRLCEGLNYNDKTTKIYSERDLRRFLDPDLLCGKLNQ